MVSYWYLNDTGNKMIILVGGRKGGSGKSTITVNLATALANTNKDVMLVDADVQLTSSEWHIEREEEQADKAKIHCVQKRGKIHETLKDLDQRYEYVLVDPAGKDSEELRSAMVVADILLIPVRPSQFDLNTLSAMHEIIEQSKLINPKLKVYCILSMSPTNPVINETALAQDYIADFSDIKLMKTIIRDRKIYRDCGAGGIGVIESESNSESGRKAKVEMTELLEEVLNAD